MTDSESAFAAEGDPPRRSLPLTFPEALSGVQATVDRLLARRPARRVLDAGCGGRMHIALGRDAHTVGIDISAEELSRNQGLDERIVGDIQCLALPERSFDVVICWDVLEHLRRPRKALENLVTALKPGGILVVAGPNPMSMKGIATWITPFWLHEAVYRRAFGRDSAVHPFRIHRRLSILPKMITFWGRRRSMQIEHFVTFEGEMQSALRQRLRMTGRVWNAMQAVVLWLSLGWIDLAATDFMLVLRKQTGTDR